MVFLVLAGLLNTGLTVSAFYKSNAIFRFSLINTLIYVVMFILLFQQGSWENFFFEVSPTRKKCLMDQVSRKNFGKKMPCSCCQKGTTGGIPPNYAQWLGESDSDTTNWFRPDFVEYVDSFSNGQECKSRPVKQPVYIQHI
jgi:hypothetical protein